MTDAAPTPTQAAPGDRKPIWWLPWTPQEVARRFHLAYEQFAPDFGYETRADTKVFDPYSANGQLMIAVVRNVLIEQASDHVSEYATLLAERDALAAKVRDHEAAIAAMRSLAFAARTSGGVAGRDSVLCEACERAEKIIERHDAKAQP